MCKVDLMLDSGAFSAWKLTKQIDLRAYIKYVKRNRSLIAQYVNLDVLPGEFECGATSTQVEQSAAQGYKNLQIMKDAGLRPIPVFHQGERLQWLERMLRDGEPYIGLSFTKRKGQLEQKIQWLDQAFSLITDAKGRPLIKVHGFGITNLPLLLRYPWATVDSTTWSRTPGFGTVIVPQPKTTPGTFDYLKPPVRIILSGIVQQSSSNQKHYQFESLGPIMAEHVGRYITDVLKTNITALRYDTTERRRAGLLYFQEFERLFPGGIAFKHPPATFNAAHNASKTKGLSDVHLVIYHATQIANKDFSAILTSTNTARRLLSYWELKDKSDDLLHKYIESGTLGEHIRKVPKPNRGESYNNFRRLQLHARILSTPDPDQLEE